MAQTQKLMLLYCEENLHAGAGSSTGTIDLPIQREGHTKFPKIESSSLRGAIRESIGDNIDEFTKEYIEHQLKAEPFFKGEKNTNEWKKFESSFGKWDSGDQQSALDFPDAKLLLFPVRSYKGIFAWITCPLVLTRFEKDYKNWTKKELGLHIGNLENSQIITQSDSGIVATDKVLLEEFLFTNLPGIFPKIGTEDFGEWVSGKLDNAHSIIKQMKSNLAVVSDEVFRDFVQLYTAKMTRNKINSDTGTADGGALFNEEFLPSESLLYSFVLASDEFKKKDYMKHDEVMEFFTVNLPKLIRVGGDKGIGKGLVRTSLIV